MRVAWWYVVWFVPRELGGESFDGLNTGGGGSKSAKADKMASVLKSAGVERLALDAATEAEGFAELGTAGGDGWTGHRAV